MVVAYVAEGRRADKTLDLLSNVDYRIARSDDDREAVFRLRYEAYMREGAINPNISRIFSDDYDDSPSSWIFGVYLDDELAGSVRIHLADHPNALCPSLNTFPDVLLPALDAGGVIVDSTRFVVNTELSQRFRADGARGLAYVTLRLCWMAVEHFQATHFLAAVRSEHQAFYKRTFGHKLMCPARPYAMLKSPIALMSVSYVEAAASVYERYPFFRSNAFERRMLFETVSEQLAVPSEAGSTMPTAIEGKPILDIARQ